MYDFEKMKKCKHFFEKTRKKFVLLLNLRCFSKKMRINGDFCLNIALFVELYVQYVSVISKLVLKMDL